MQIDHPFSFAADGRTATTDELDHIEDMIEAVLLTRQGERVNQPEFGSGLWHLVHGPNSREIAVALTSTVHADLQQWLSDVIAITGVEVTAVDSTLSLRIEYRLRLTGESHTHTVEVSL